MTDTSDFRAWLEENQPEGHEEIFCLYKAVESQESHGLWDVSVKDDKTFIKGPSGTLQLLSDKARIAFLKAVEALKDDKEMDMDSWYGFKVAMAKDD